MGKGLVAKASESVRVPVSAVWDALVNPKLIRQYMFGTEVVSGWKEGSPIAWKGVWQGRSYEDKGTITGLQARRVLSYSHFSPLSALTDAPENYHTVTIKLTAKGSHTIVSLTQDNNSSEEEREHSEKNWAMMLASLKRLLEGRKPESKK